MSEIEVYSQGSTLPAKVEYAKLLASSGLLPRDYRQSPANILWAMEYGSMLGLAPMAAITGVHVIEGKPTASAGLISALVRRAGHKLRIRGDARSATCQIIRADDPDYTFEVTFTIDDAKAAGLIGKKVWQQYAASMLKARAITQCARDACEEALYGLHYTPEELGAEVDGDGEIVGEVTAGEPRRPARAAAQPEPQGEAIPGPGTTQRMTEVPADDPWYGAAEPAAEARPRVTRPEAAETDPAWLDLIGQKIDQIRTRDGGTQVYAEVIAAFNDRTCTPADRNTLLGLVTAKVSAVMAEQEATADEAVKGDAAA